MADYKVYSDTEEQLTLYSQRVHAGEKAMKRWIPRAKDFIRRYRNEVRADQYTVQGHRVNVPIGTGMIDSMHSALTATDVEIVLRALAKGTRDQARVAEQAMRNVWREADVDSARDAACKDALLVGIGWVKVGYDYADEEKEVPRSEEDIQADVDQVINESVVRGLKPPSPDEVAQVVPVTERVVEVKRDRIVVDYVPWEDLIYDHTAKRVEDIRWVCLKSLVPAYEVHTNQEFRDYLRRHNIPFKELEDIVADAEVSSEITGREATEDDDRITLLDYYDFEAGVVCTFPKSQPKLKLLERAIPFAFMDDLRDRNPFVPLITRVDPDNVRGIADMELLAPSLDELNMYRSNLATYLERMKPKVMGPESAFNEAGRQAMQSQEWGAFVPLDGGVDVNQIKTLEPPPIPQEFFGMQERIMLDMREATGINEMMRGFFSDRKRTATEAMAVEAGSNMRHGEKFSRMQKFLEDVARRVLILMQLFYEQPRITRLSEDSEDVDWEWTADDIVLEADLEINLSPKEVRDSAARQERAVMLINLVAPLPEADRVALVKLALDDMGYSREDIRMVLKTPEEAQIEQMQQAQMAAASQQASDGVPPSPASIPGPLSGDEVLAAANEGEVPPELLNA